VVYAAQQAAAYPYAVPCGSFLNGFPNINFVRKRPSDAGCVSPAAVTPAGRWAGAPASHALHPACRSWDWGPAMGPTGIWRSVYLNAFRGARLTDFWLEVTRLPATAGQGDSPHRTQGAGPWPPLAPITPGDSFVLHYYAALACEPGTALSVAFSTAGLPAASVARAFNCSSATDTRVNATTVVPASAVKMWWPRGYGDQNLYNASATLSLDPSANRTRTFGFREALLVRTPLPDGGLSFYMQVNGVPIFAKGASVVPLDAFDARVSDVYLEQMLQSAAEANYNTFRVWGGGDYLRDSFWDMCDRMGFLVWLDFQFATVRV
jgi:beta-mannosidase